MLDGNRRRDLPIQLPGGAGDLTLAELQEMSSRQQQQMEAQQQVLVAKEQRLKYLKQQEARHAQLASESEQLKRIRERVENQELKLKKLRALRGQAEQYRINNGHLTSELDAVKAVFNEKEKELAMAVARVDQLTRQLQELRGQGVNTGQPAASVELEKLRKELMIRNKLNEQQSNTIAAKEKLLSHRRDEVSRLDSRIHELQQRLKKRRNQEQLNSQNEAKKPAPAGPSKHGSMAPNVATVEPYIQYAPSNVIKDDSFKKTGSFAKQDPKYQTLPTSVKFVPPSSSRHSEEIRAGGGQKRMEMNNNNEFIEEYPLPMVLPADRRKTTPASSTVSTNNNNRMTDHHNSDPAHKTVQPQTKPGHPTNRQPVAPARLTSSAGWTDKVTGFASQERRPDANRGSHMSDSSAAHKMSGPHEGREGRGAPSVMQPVISILEEERQAGSGQSSPASTEGSDSSGGLQVKADNEINTSPLGPVSAMIEKLNSTQQPVGGTSRLSKPEAPGSKMPAATTTATSAPHSPHLNQKPAPTYRYASKSQIANTYMGRLGSAAMEKYQRNLNMMYRTAPEQGPADSRASAAPPTSTDHGQTQEVVPSEATGPPQFGAVASPNYPDIASDKGSYKLNTPKQVRRRHSDSENEEMNKALQERQEFERAEQEKVAASKTGFTGQTVTAENKLPPGNKEKASTQVDQRKTKTSNTSKMDSTVSTEKVVRRTKSNLKQEGVRRSTNRVSFDPLALLLDASLEGELDLVKKVAVQVDNVSTANDEGITALHNAICAGHYDIVKFLVQFGCDVNSPDSDGWTPLHCAASCNNLPMVRFLVEHGACVFAATISDQETAADKCEEDEDGYESCSDYLYSIQEKLGITNSGEAYAVFDYQASATDELSFQIGDKLMVLRKGDEKEKEWWWAQRQGKEGYIPRNLLGLHPRVLEQPKEVSEC